MGTIRLVGMWTPGPLELTVVLVLTVLIFGRRLPEMARNMGRSLHEFKKGLKDARDIKTDVENEAKGALGLDEIN